MTIKNAQWFKENGYEFITPESARDMLANNTQNRKIRESFVKSLVGKIESGNWQPFTLDAIGFYEDGSLANGQHRLTAISKSNVEGVWAKVERHIPKEAAIAIDTGKSRSASDNIKILTGKNFYTTRISNMVSLSAAGSNNKNLTPEHHYKIAQKYENEILFVKSLFAGCPRYIQSAQIMASVFMALFAGVDKEILQQFVSTLSKPVASSELDVYVISFRDKLFQEYYQKSSKSRRNYAYEIKRCQNVIYNYVNNTPKSKIAYPEYYRYPLIDFEV